MSQNLPSPPPDQPQAPGQPALLPQRTPANVAVVALLLSAFVAAFLFLGGWFTPRDLTPARFVDGFEKTGGVHPGFRRNHAKGVGVSGTFESNGQGARLSKAGVFAAGRVPVIGRFSLSGTNPYVADGSQTVRGLGLQFSPPSSEVWRTAMVNLPVFPVRTPTAFLERILASAPDPKTGAADPEKMTAFLARYPEAVMAGKIIQGEPFSSGFSNSAFHSLNAFLFVNAEGVTTPVRWVLEPLQPFAPIEETTDPSDKNFLFDALISQIHQGPLEWKLVVIVGEAGDPTNDASIPWPAERERVEVGTLTLDRIDAEATSPATSLNFDPLVLPDGILPSDDPLLSARSAVYSQSFTRRAGENAGPSAVTPAEVADAPPGEGK